jgi:hypothetical protein
VQNQRWLAGIYLEYGHALYQLGKAGQMFQYDNALTVFSGFERISQEGSEPWWICKAMGLRILLERGEGNDLRVADAAMSLLAGNYPDFDEGKFGMKEMLADLRVGIQALQGIRK